MRTYLCLPGAWMGAWSWQFVLERLRAAGHDARALPFRGVGERAAELSPELDNDVFLADTIAALEQRGPQGGRAGRPQLRQPDRRAW